MFMTLTRRGMLMDSNTKLVLFPNFITNPSLHSKKLIIFGII